MRTISFADVIKKMVGGKVIVAVIVILAVIAGMGLGYVRSKAESKEIKKGMSAEYKKAIKVLQEEEETLNKAKEEATQQIEEYEKYMASSVYFQIDPNNVQDYVLSISVDAESADKASIAANIYGSCVNDGRFAAKMAELLTVTDASYLSELISGSVNGNVISIEIIHNDRAALEGLAAVTKDAFTACQSGVSTDANYTFFGEAYSVKMDNNILEAQNVKREKLVEYQKDLADAEKRLAAQSSSLQDYKADYSHQDASSPSLVVNIFKYAIVLGAVAVVGLFALFALLIMYSPKIQTVTDYTDNLKVSYMGSVAEDSEYCVTFALMKAMKESAKKVLIIGSNLSDASMSEAKEKAEAFAKKLTEAGVDAKVCDEVMKKSDSVKALHETDAVIMAETSGKSLLKDAHSMKALCDSNDVKVLGAVELK